jgi:alpha-beta hydrolase superfamily lysophospholipase
VVQIAHGASEHAMRYQRFARFLNAAGYIVYANDHRGHGKTAGSLDKAGIASDG